RVGPTLQFTDDGLSSRGRIQLKLETVRTKWEAVGKAAAQPRPDTLGALNEQFDGVAADLRGMIGHAGDTSNLILDPDLDSYYLMDAVLLALPQTIDRMRTIDTALLPVLSDAGAPLTPEMQTKAAVFASMLREADIARIQGDLDTSFKEDANFSGVSPTL